MTEPDESKELELSRRNGADPARALTAPILPQRGHHVVGFWKLLLFLLVVLLIGPEFIYRIGRGIFGPINGARGAELLLFVEAGRFCVLLGMTAVMALVERQKIGEYGLPARAAFGANFGLGFLLGMAEISVVVGLITLTGHYSVIGFELQGAQIVRWALFHLLLFVFVGLYEESAFRGYAQHLLARGIGFWPAAVLLSVGFGLVHRENSGESWSGIASVMLVGLLFAFTLKRSGNLWYAVGMHAGFDWGQSFLYSVRDSGIMLPGHLLNAAVGGPSWLTGGTVGPEASVLCFVTMGLQFLVVAWLFPAKRSEESRKA